MTAAAHDRGLSLAPFRAVRPAVDAERLGRMLSPPYDVIDDSARASLLAADPDNAVSVILPPPTDEGYAGAAAQLDERVRSGLYRPDDAPAIYVYEMADADQTTRGLLGAVELRAPEDGVILPHENTMAGPVADRLRVMTETATDLEPIYLVYDGHGPASHLVAEVGERQPLATARTPDGVAHRLWAISDPAELAAIEQDLAGHHALIADGHHRYATYRERQRAQQEQFGPGPWDRGLALLVDTTEYGPAVHAIHRVVHGIDLAAARERLEPLVEIEETDATPEQALQDLADPRDDPAFAAVLTNGRTTLVIRDVSGALADQATRPGDIAALAALDVSVLHHGVVESVWALTDDEATVDYAHSAPEAVERAERDGGVAVLLRPTPVAAVAAVAAAGARMPRKSTLFTPKPASGLVMRRLADQDG